EGVRLAGTKSVPAGSAVSSSCDAVCSLAVSAWEVARWVPPAVAIRAIEAVSATAPVSSGRRFLSPGQAITGRSTKRYSSHASGIATAPSSSRTAWESVTSSPAATCGITCSGQCTRYSEYEIAPITWKGARLSRRLACRPPGRAPADDHQRRGDHRERGGVAGERG